MPIKEANDEDYRLGQGIEPNSHKKPALLIFTTACTPDNVFTK